MVDLFPVLLVTTNASLKPPRYCCFMGCKVHAERFAGRTEELIETYARWVSNEKSDISSSDHVVDACKIVFRALNGLRSKKWMRVWKVPAHLYRVQIFPLHFMHFLHLLVDPSYFERGRQIQLDQ